MISNEDFQKLSMEEQAVFFRQAPVADKGGLILLAHQPERLTHSLSEEELYLVTRPMDLEERGAILRYADLRQLFFMADIDCWKKDRIDSDGFLKWIETLEHAGDNKLFSWLAEMDYETVVTGLKGLVRVLKPEWEYAADETLEDRPCFSLDQMYYLYVAEENFDTVKRAIEVLFENHRGRYTAILEGILGEVDETIEEEAYANREVRLGDRGFPSPESANAIYRPIEDREFEAFPKKTPREYHEQKIAFSGLRMPDYPALWTARRFFLDEVLFDLDRQAPQVLEEIREELAWLSNKVIAAEGFDFSSEETFRKGIERVHAIVSLGLEILSERDLARAQALIAERWIETIFRFAITRVTALRERVKGIVKRFWKGDTAAFFVFLGEPYGAVLRAAAARLPQWVDLSAQDEARRCRDFRTRQEWESVQKSIEQVEVIHEKISVWTTAWQEACAARVDSIHDDAHLFPLLGTAFAHGVVSARISLKPLSLEALNGFLDSAFEVRGQGLCLRADKKERFLQHFLGAQERDLLASLWGIVFERIEDDLGRIRKPVRADDLPFIKGLWISSLPQATKRKRSP
ncbi:MAG: DUF6178 family protein [Candidatus Omnitrophota bacterium]